MGLSIGLVPKVALSNSVGISHSFKRPPHSASSTLHLIAVIIFQTHKYYKLQGVISLSTHYLSLICKYSPQHLIRKQRVQIHYLEQGWPTIGSQLKYLRPSITWKLSVTKFNAHNRCTGHTMATAWAQKMFRNFNSSLWRQHTVKQ